MLPDHRTKLGVEIPLSADKHSSTSEKSTSLSLQDVVTPGVKLMIHPDLYIPLGCLEVQISDEEQVRPCTGTWTEAFNALPRLSLPISTQNAISVLWQAGWLRISRCRSTSATTSEIWRFYILPEV